MSQPSLISSAQSDALRREIDRQVKAEIDELLQEAEREARETVAEAYATARRRVGAAIAELRKEGARLRDQARAEMDTERRRRAQSRDLAAVRGAWPLLRDALETRWTEDAARKRWSAAVAGLARTRLLPGGWLVEHPEGWAPGEQEAFRAALGDHGADAPAFRRSTEIAAGLRISARRARLDATPGGLLADESEISSLILAAIEREAAP